MNAITNFTASLSDDNACKLHGWTADGQLVASALLPELPVDPKPNRVAFWQVTFINGVQCAYVADADYVVECHSYMKQLVAQQPDEPMQQLVPLQDDQVSLSSTISTLPRATSAAPKHLPGMRRPALRVPGGRLNQSSVFCIFLFEAYFFGYLNLLIYCFLFSRSD